MNIDGNEPRKKTPEEQEEPPPLLRSWKYIYTAIALYTCALIVILYFITAALNR